MVFVNTSPLPIRRILILVDYFDDQHQRMFTLIYNRDSGAQRMGQFFERRLPITVPGLKDVMAPGQRIETLGSSPLTAETCPSAGEVTMVEATFEDGSSTSWSAARWHLDADIENAPHFKFPRLLVPTGNDILATAQIGSDGKAQELTPLGNVSAPAIAAIRAQLTNWTFLPPLEDGKPSAGALKLLFRFYPDPNSKYVSVAEVKNLPPGPFVVVDLVLKEPEGPYWNLLFANTGVPEQH
ncbi:MAG: hypothetical protein WCD43_01010 [Candidatus Acidiferrales bacterium]